MTKTCKPKKKNPKKLEVKTALPLPLAQQHHLLIQAGAH